METVACELCGAYDAEEVLRQRDVTHGLTDEEFTVCRCRTCGLLYLNPRPAPSDMGRYYPEQYYADPVPKQRTAFEQAAKRWSARLKRWVREDYYGYPSLDPPAGFRRLLRTVVAWPDKVWRTCRGREILPWTGRGRLLDVGCGPGSNLASFAEQGWDVYGIDASPVAVERARARVGNRVTVGDLASAHYPDRSFDVVLFSHSLEHMAHPLEVLKEARRILDDRGLLVIRVPNAGSWEAGLFGRWWFPWELPRHLYHFDRRSLGYLLAQAGFRVVRWRTAVGSLFFMASLERVWRYRLKRPLPARRLIEHVIAKPFCLVAGHLGYGTEIAVQAVKSQAEAPATAHREFDDRSVS